MSAEILKQADDALTARELIKGQALETCPISPREAAEEIAAATSCEVVQVVGPNLCSTAKTKRSQRSSCPRRAKRKRRENGFRSPHFVFRFRTHSPAGGIFPAGAEQLDRNSF